MSLALRPEHSSFFAQKVCVQGQIKRTPLGDHYFEATLTFLHRPPFVPKYTLYFRKHHLNIALVKVRMCGITNQKLCGIYKQPCMNVQREIKRARPWSHHAHPKAACVVQQWMSEEMNEEEVGVTAWQNLHSNSLAPYDAPVCYWRHMH